MRSMAQRVQEQNVEVFKFRERRFRYLAEVGEIRRRTKAIPDDLRISMQNGYWFELSTEDLQVSIQRVQFNPREPSELVGSRKNVGEDLADALGSARVRIKRNGTLALKCQRSKIVETKDVVGMR